MDSKLSGRIVSQNPHSVPFSRSVTDSLMYSLFCAHLGRVMGMQHATPLLLLSSFVQIKAYSHVMSVLQLPLASQTPLLLPADSGSLGPTQLMKERKAPQPQWGSHPSTGGSPVEGQATWPLLSFGQGFLSVSSIIWYTALPTEWRTGSSPRRGWEWASVTLSPYCYC